MSFFTIGGEPRLLVQHNGAWIDIEELAGFSYGDYEQPPEPSPARSDIYAGWPAKFKAQMGAQMEALLEAHASDVIDRMLTAYRSVVAKGIFGDLDFSELEKRIVLVTGDVHEYGENYEFDQMYGGGPLRRDEFTYLKEPQRRWTIKDDGRPRGRGSVTSAGSIARHERGKNANMKRGPKRIGYKR